MSKRCNKCVSTTSECIKCCENEIYKNVPTVSYFKAYHPVCPRGYKDCVLDPAYIKYKNPKLYKELYGEFTPQDAIYVENGCMERYKEDPNEEYYCYDDGDK